MKLLNTEEFAKLPEGTLFNKYEPCVLEDLQIKGKTIHLNSNTSGDAPCWAQWYEATLDIEANDGNITLSLKSGDSSPLEVAYTRNVHPPEQLFAVWEKEDLIKLKDIIDTALNISYTTTFLNLLDTDIDSGNVTTITEDLYKKAMNLTEGMPNEL